ncbi:MAG: isoleucine--tRNA ligase [Patescibacteria group bacterium]|jgi:isoleucyl-tRNA synthetase
MYNANQEEQKILEFWEKDKTFEKSVTERPEKKRYVFYDGPPFATGLPHYGHIVASLMKDVVPRFWTMRGFRVERKWGWDCHGLPVENIIEKDLNLASKKDIVNFGIANFNEACRSTVLKYAEEWKKTIRRMGRWVDMENDYRTMDKDYMESVWWVFRQLWDKELIYKGHKPMHICPRCVTPLSNFEVTQGYKDIKDLSAVAKFKVLKSELSEKLKIPAGTSILAWTTTPWTLPGNVLLAANADVDYDLIKVAPSVDGEEVAGEARYEAMDNYIIARDRIKEVFKEKGYLREASFRGSDLVGLTYEPLFPYFKDTPNAFRVVTAEFVSTAEGTGIVHIAPAYGEDDFGVGKRENIPLVQHVTMEGRFVAAVGEFAGLEVKPIDDVMRTDIEMIKWLAANDKLFSKQKIEHSYPHCWRCDTPLLNYAATSWFVRVSEMKDQLLKNNDAINWIPDHIKDGRFGKWLEGARDWAISRSRFWGTPLPVWEADDGDVICVGSVAELEELTGKKVTDLHIHKISDLVITKNGKKYRPINEVLDCWFESGSMPYGEMHYPFENKKKFEEAFPAEFIAEGQDQTRGWFYTLHILAAALTSGRNPAISKKILHSLSFTNNGTPAFKNVIVNGIVLAEDGKKMSKRLKNYPDPEVVIQKYGADAMRYYLVSSPVMEAESLNFSEAGMREMYNRLINTWYNVLEFYQMFSDTKHGDAAKSKNILDRWILVKLQKLVNEVTFAMENYKLADASRPIVEFITELSQWYVRRSRDRFKGDNVEDKAFALGTLREVLLVLSKVSAPFTPFISEKVYRELTNNIGSVHLEKWPDTTRKVDEKVIDEMKEIRKIVEMGLSLRAESGIKVRQVLSEFSVSGYKLDDGASGIIADELNVNKVMAGNVADPRWITKEDGKLKVALNTEITTDLKKQGLIREIVRSINQIRKEMKLTIEDKVVVSYSTEDEILLSVFKESAEEISKAVLAQKIQESAEGTEVKIDDRSVKLKVVKA